MDFSISTKERLASLQHLSTILLRTLVRGKKRVYWNKCILVGMEIKAGVRALAFPLDLRSRTFCACSSPSAEPALEQYGL